MNYSIQTIEGSLDVELQKQANKKTRLLAKAGENGFSGRFSIIKEFSIDNPWFMLPGIFSGLGRQDQSKVYPQICLDPDPSDIWQQNHWSFALERMALPMAGVHDGNKWYIWQSDTHYKLNQGKLCGAQDHEPQAGYGFSWTQGLVKLQVNIPAVEGPTRHVRSPLTDEKLPYLELEPGGTFSIDLQWHELEGTRYDFAKIQRQVEEEIRPNNPAADFVIEPEEYAEIANDGLKDWHWQGEAKDGRPGYFIYTAAMDRSVEFNANYNKGTTLCWHFDSLGFVGGFPIAYGLFSRIKRQNISLDDPWSQELINYTNRLATKAFAPSGLFYTSYHPSKGRNQNGEYENGPDQDSYTSCWLPEGQLHARTEADALWHLARIINLFDGQIPQVETWKDSCIKVLRTTLKAQREDGRHPQIYSAETGQAHSFDGDGGLLWITAMLEVTKWSTDQGLNETLLDSVRRAGEAYQEKVHDWWVCGAPEDVGNSPTSEDAGNAVLAYSRLYDLDGDKWLKNWKIATDYMLTWRKAYNVQFSKYNMLKLADFRTNGGDYASNHNNHLHGYEVNCISDMYKLSEVLNDPHYAMRAKDHLCFLLQLLCREPGQWNGQRGMLTEQFYICDWSIFSSWSPGLAHVQKGTFMGFSHSWCINMVLLGIDEWFNKLRK